MSENKDAADQGTPKEQRGLAVAPSVAGQESKGSTETAETIAKSEALGPPAAGNLSFVELARRAWEFLKTPANFLSLLAIIATVIVPAIDKILKTEESRRAKIDKLLELTDKIINVRKEIEQVGPTTTADPSKRGLLEASRQDYLSGAFELARSMQHQVNPPILLVLAGELLSDGRYDEARIFSAEVLRRGTNEQKSEAHVLLAGCFTDKVVKGYSLTVDEKHQFHREMESAIAFFPDTNVDEVSFRRASVLSEWSKMDDEMNDTNAANQHRSVAEMLLAKIPARVQTHRPADALPGTHLNDRALPNSSIFQVYKITFPDDPERTETLTCQDSISHIAGSDTVNVYVGAQFKGAWEMEHASITALTNGATEKALRITWEQVIPIFDGKKPVTHANWIIDVLTNGCFQGTESEYSKPPHRMRGLLVKSQ